MLIEDSPTMDGRKHFEEDPQWRKMFDGGLKMEDSLL